MKKQALAIVAALAVGTPVAAHGQPDIRGTSTGTCVLPTYLGGDGRPHPCSALPSSAPSAAGVNPILQQAVTTLGTALLESLFSNSPQNAAQQAAEQQRMQQQLEQQRQEAAERRQRIYDRVNGFLAASGLGTIEAPGVQWSDVQSMIDADKPGIDFDGINPATGAGIPDVTAQPAPTGDPNVVDLRNCGGANAPCPAPAGDFGVVDLASVQQGVDLAVVAANAPAADQQAILDQALAAANGDKTVQVHLAPTASAPIVDQDGLQAFQKANAEYRQAHDSQYRSEKAFADRMQKCQQGSAVISRIMKARLGDDLENREDAMTLAQQHAALAKVLEAGLDEQVECGNEDARIELNLQNTDWAKFEAEQALTKIAHVNPPKPPHQQAISESDLRLLLPGASPAGPAKADMSLVEDSIMAKPVEIPAEAVNTYPPAVALKYKADPAFAQQMNQMHAGLYAAMQNDYRTAAQEAESTWHNGLARLSQQGMVKSSVPLDQQEAADPQLHNQLERLRKEITSRLDYRCTAAHAREEIYWEGWVKTQEAHLTGQPELDPTYLLFP